MQTQLEGLCTQRGVSDVGCGCMGYMQLAALPARWYKSRDKLPVLLSRGSVTAPSLVCRLAYLLRHRQ